MDILNRFTKKQLIIFGSLFAAIIILLIVLIGIKSTETPSVPVKITIIPYESSVTVDGNPITNESTLNLTLGSHDIFAQYENYEDLSTTINVESDTTKYIKILTPANQAGEEDFSRQLESHPEISGIAAQIAIEKGEKERKDYPIVTLLPITNSIYKIGYNYDANDNFYVSIKTNANYYINSAVKKLTSLKISFLDYQVIIRDYTSPFGTPVNNSSSDLSDFIRNAFPSVNFSIKDISTSSDPNYSLITLTTGSEETYSLVTYYAITHKRDSSWELVSPVYPIITKKSAPSVPENILKEIKY